MSIKRLILCSILLGIGAPAFADADLNGTWTMKLDAAGGAPRGARTLPKTLEIKLSGDKIDITGIDAGNERMLYACSKTKECVGLPGYWARWDGADLVLELRAETARTLYRMYLSPDKQNLLLRVHDDPKAIAFPYLKQK